MARQGDVTVTIAVVLRNLQTAMRNLRSSINSIQGMSNQVLSDVAFNGQKIQKIFGGFENAVKSPLVNTSQGAQALKNNIDEVNNAGKQMGEDFPGYAMTLMFAGMILQRAFHNIWKSATTTFNKVMSKVDGQTTSFERLSNSVEYLKFTMGQALEPIAEWMIPIVNNLADWVSKNPGLARFGTIVLGIAGYMAFFGGNLILTIDALGKMGSKMAGSLPTIKSWGSSIVSLGQKIGTYLITKIKAAGAALASAPAGALVGWALTLSSILALVETISTQQGITWWEAFQELLKNIWNGFVDIFNGILQITIKLVENMTKPWNWLFDKIAEGFEWLLNNVIIPHVDSMIRKFNAIPGVMDISTIGEVDFEVGEAIDDAYDQAQLNINEAAEAIKFDALQAEDAEMGFGEAFKKSMQDRTNQLISLLGIGKNKNKSSGSSKTPTAQTNRQNSAQTYIEKVEVNDNIDMREFKRQYLSGR